MDLNAKHSAQEVALATGATPKQITDWCNQGLVIGQREPLGRGNKRQFSFFNIMEIASAMELMLIGVASPGDAFRAAQKFSHTGDGGAPWKGDDGAWTDNDPHRLPGLPFHHVLGETFLAVAGAHSKTVLSENGSLDLLSLGRELKALGLIVLDISAVFSRVVNRMGQGDARDILDHIYEQAEA